MKKIVLVVILTFISIISSDICNAYLIEDYFNSYDTNSSNDNSYYLTGDYIDGKKFELNIELNTSNWETTFNNIFNIIVYYDISKDMTKSEIIKYKAQIYKIIDYLDKNYYNYIVVPAGTDLLELSNIGYNLDEIDSQLYTDAINTIMISYGKDYWTSLLKTATASNNFAGSPHIVLNDMDYKIINISSNLNENSYFYSVDEDSYFYSNNESDEENEEENEKYLLNCKDNKYTIKDYSNEYVGEYFFVQYGYTFTNNYCKDAQYANETNLNQVVENILANDVSNKNERKIIIPKNLGHYEIESVHSIVTPDGDVEESEIILQPETETEPAITEPSYTITLKNYIITSNYNYNIKLKLKLKDEYYNDTTLDEYFIQISPKAEFNGVEEEYTFDGYFNINNKFDLYLNNLLEGTYRVGDLINLKNHENEFKTTNNEEEFLGFYIVGDFDKISQTQFYMPGQEVYVDPVYGKNYIKKYTDNSDNVQISSKTSNNSLSNANITDNINIIFADYCWEYIEDSTGNTRKVIYNGEPDDFGMCGPDRSNHSGYTELTDVGIMSVYKYFSNYSYNPVNKKLYLTGEVKAYSSSSDVFEHLDEIVGTYFCKSQLGVFNSCDDLYYIDYIPSNQTNYMINAYKITNDINYDSIAKTQFRNFGGVGYMNSNNSMITNNYYLTKTKKVTDFISDFVNNYYIYEYGSSYTINEYGEIEIDNPQIFYPSTNSLSDLLGKYVDVIYNNDEFIFYIIDIHDNGVTVLKTYKEDHTQDYNLLNDKLTYYYADSYIYSDFYDKYILKNLDNSYTIKKTDSLNWHLDMEGKTDFYMCFDGSSCTNLIHVYKTGKNGFSSYNNVYFGNDISNQGNHSNLLLNTVNTYDGPGHHYFCSDYEGDNNYPGYFNPSSHLCGKTKYVLDSSLVNTTGITTNYSDDLIFFKIMNIDDYNSETMLDKALHGSVDTNIKDVIDAWYKNNLLKYSQYIVDLPFYQNTCVEYTNTFNHDGNNFDDVVFSDNCIDNESLYSVSNKVGNGKLTYPIGIFSQGPSPKNNSYWIGTLGSIYDYNSQKYISYYDEVEDDILQAFPSEKKDVRPVIYLAPSLDVIGGDGTIENPFVMDDGSNYSIEYKNKVN